MDSSIVSGGDGSATTWYTQDETIGLRVTLRRENLELAPSCIDTFAQIELLYLVSGGKCLSYWKEHFSLRFCVN